MILKLYDYEPQEKCIKCLRLKGVSFLLDGVCETCKEEPEQLSLELGKEIKKPRQKPQHYRERETYKIKCESCGRDVFSQIEPYACGKCSQCWHPWNYSAFMKIWEENTPK